MSSSSSSSSDSESDHTSKENSKKNGRVKSGFRKVKNKSKQGLETAFSEDANQERELAETSDDNESLKLECLNALRKLEEAEKVIGALKTETANLISEKSKLVTENDGLNSKLAHASKLEAELNQNLEALSRERDDLIAEKLTATKKINDGEKILEELKTEAVQLRDEKETLHQELQRSQGKFYDVKETLRSSEKEVADLINSQKLMLEENNTVALKVSELSKDIEKAEDKIRGLMAESSQLKEKLNEKEEELLNLAKMHDVYQSEASSQIKLLEAHVSGLELELNSLSKQKGQSEELIASKTTEAEQLREENSKLQDCILNLDKLLKEKDDDLSGLQKKVEDAERESSVKIEELGRSKNSEIDQLKEEKEGAQGRVFELVGALKEKGDALFVLQKKFEDRDNEASAQGMTFIAKISSLQAEVDSLQVHKGQSEEWIASKTTEAEEMGRENLRLQARILDVDKLLKERDDELSCLQKKVEDAERESSVKREELGHQLRSKNCEIEQLREEKQGTQSRVFELEGALQEKGDELFILQKKIEDRDNEASAQCMTLIAKISSLQAEVDSLQVQKGELEELIASKMTDAEEVRRENLRLQAHILYVDKLLKERDEELSLLQKKVEDAERQSSVQKEELGHQLRSKNCEIEQLRKEQQGAQSRVSELEGALKERGDEIFGLQKKFEDRDNEASAQGMTLIAKISSFQAEVDSLQVRKGQLEGLIASKTTEAEEIGRENLRLQAHILDVDKLLKERDDKLSRLQKKVEDAERESSVKIEELGHQLRSKNSEIEQLREEKQGAQSRVFELEGALKERGDELFVLQKRFEDRDNEASAQCMTLIAKVNGLQAEVNSLQVHEGQLEELIASKTTEAEEIGLESLRLQARILDVDKLLKERDDELSCLQKKVEDAERESSVKIDELEHHLGSKNSEIDQLREEKQGAQSKVFELEGAQKERGDELSVLQKRFEDRDNEASAQGIALIAQVSSLQAEVDSLKAQKEELEEQLVHNSNEAWAQIKASKDEAAKMQLELDSLQNQKADLELQIEKKNLETSEVLIQIENFKTEIEIKNAEQHKMLKEAEGLTERLKDLELEIGSLHDQRTKLEEQIRIQVTETDHLRVEKERLQDRVFDVENTLMQREDEVSVLQMKLQDSDTDASAFKMTLTTKVNTMRQELESLHTRNSQLENQNLELMTKIEEQQQLLKEQEDSLDKLRYNYKQLEANLQIAEAKLKDEAEEFWKKIESKDQKFANLEIMVKDLKRVVDIKGDEVNAATENVQAIEVALRLSNQKLHVTEQLLAEKEEEHKILIKISEKVNNMLTGLESTMKRIEEDFRKFEYCISETSKELWVAKKWVADTTNEKEELRKNVVNLVKQLETKAEEELVWTEKVERLEVKVNEDEVEKERLVTEVNQLEKKVGELEAVMKEKVGNSELKAKRVEMEKERLGKEVSHLEKKLAELERVMKEKDEGMVGLGEEKREAIRQLCVWIDYHCGRCDYYKDMVSKLVARSRTTAA